MASQPSFFTARERRIGVMAVLAAAVLTLGLIAAERAVSPPLGIYGADTPAMQAADVVDARPLSRASL